MAGKTAEIKRIVNLGTGLAWFALLALLVSLLFWNFNEISRSIGRLQRLIVPGMLELTFQEFRTPDYAQGRLKWATYNRVSEVEVVGAKLDEDEKAEKCQKDPANAEWVEIRATTFPVDLAGGYIGDSSELRQIPENTPVLEVGKCIRIVTFGEAPIKKGDEGDICIDAVSVKPFPGEKPGGFLKKDPGEADRIVVFDRYRRPVLDMDYWIIPQECSSAQQLKRAFCKIRSGARHFAGKRDIPPVTT